MGGGSSGWLFKMVVTIVVKVDCFQGHCQGGCDHSCQSGLFSWLFKVVVTIVVKEDCFQGELFSRSLSR